MTDIEGRLAEPIRIIYTPKRSPAVPNPEPKHGEVIAIYRRVGFDNVIFTACTLRLDGVNELLEDVPFSRDVLVREPADYCKPETPKHRGGYRKKTDQTAKPS